MKRSKFFRRSGIITPLDPDEVLADSTSSLRHPLNLEGKMERPIERLLPLAFLLIVAGGLGYLTWRAGFLTLQQGEYFSAKSRENRFLVRPVFPPRGVIYDRFGTPMVVNIPSFGIAFEKEAFLREGGNLEELLGRLEELLREERKYFYDLGFPADGNMERMAHKIALAEGVLRDTVVELASDPARFPGISVFETYRRAYQDPLASSHVLGFIGRISQEDLLKRPDADTQELVGKSGLEAFYDDVLRGRGGKKIVEIDSRGRETRFKFTEEPREGAKIRLTVDAKLQEVVYETLQNYIGRSKGASVVALDPRDGAVRALLSYPGFDSSSFSSSLSQKEFEAILKDPLTPLFNRAVAGEFPSGSTIKPLIGVAALEEKIIDPEKKIYDEGFIEIPNPYRPGEKSVFVDWKKHGWVDFYDAIAQSANVYFYMIGGGFKDQKGLGIERIKKYAHSFGLGSRLGIDIPGERPGFIPDPESKKITEPQDPIWRVGDTYNVSIGQGGVKVTPLQMAVLTAALANGGKLYQPRLLNAVLDVKDQILDKHEPHLLREHMVGEESIQEVTKGMRKTVTSGTARLLSGLPVAAAAKTGTAQAGSGLPHAWVTVFAPFENPEIAITVMVEHAGEGSTVAVPITNEILKWYFLNRSKNQEL